MGEGSTYVFCLGYACFWLVAKTCLVRLDSAVSHQV